MYDATMLIRRSMTGTAGARSGQAVVIFVIFIAAMIGMMALAVDVGHAYERRQFLQGAAHNAALAGAFELSAGTNTQPTPDWQVVERMIDSLRQSGLTVRNSSDGQSLQTPSAPGGWTACQASPPLSPTEVYLQAFYVDNSTPPQQLGPVGTGSVPTGAAGVGVQRLAMCVSHFFAGVIGHGNFDVSVGATTPGLLVGQAETGLPSNGPISPFYMFAQKITLPDGTHVRSLYGVDAPDLGNPNGSAPWKVKCVAKGNKVSPWQVPLPTCTKSLGDLVTMTDQSPAGGSTGNNWEDVQFYNDPSTFSSPSFKADGLDFTPSGFATFDQSVRGCLNPTSLNINLGGWYYDHGGFGHCARTPKAGDTIEVLIVDYVCKNGGICQDNTLGPAACSTQNGGYCVHVVGTALVYVVTTNGYAIGKKGNLVQGYITGVYQDPDCIVELGSGQNNNCTYAY